jgi:hypothetical protein
MRTAIRLKHGRAEITAAQMRAVLQTIERDLARGVLARPPCDLDSIFRAPPPSGMWPPPSKSAALPFPRSMIAKGKSPRFANSRSFRPDPPLGIWNSEFSTLWAASGAAGSRPTRGCAPPSGVRAGTLACPGRDHRRHPAAPPSVLSVVNLPSPIRAYSCPEFTRRVRVVENPPWIATPCGLAMTKQTRGPPPLPSHHPVPNTLCSAYW